MDIKAGDYIQTPRFLRVKIENVYESVTHMNKDGYNEPTHYQNDEYEICGKHIGLNRMTFAAARKEQLI